MLLLIAIVLSIFPSVILISKLKKRNDDIDYKKSCNAAIGKGALSVLWISLISGGLFLIGVVLKLFVFQNIPTLLDRAIYKFLDLALVEEVVKFMLAKSVISKTQYKHSTADIVSYFVIIGAMFGILETALYAIGESPGVLFARAITIPHVGYAFIMGLIYAKGYEKGRKSYMAAGLIVAWFIHGLYDFSLTPELYDISESWMYLPFALAVFDFIVLIFTIRYFYKDRKKRRGL